MKMCMRVCVQCFLCAGISSSPAFCAKDHEIARMCVWVWMWVIFFRAWREREREGEGGYVCACV